VKGNIALVLDKIGKSDSALKILTDLKKRYPDFENLDRNIATIQLRCKRFKEAVETYKSLCEKEPDVADNYYGLAISYYYLGEKDKALFFIEKALEIKPNYPEALFLFKRIKKYKQ
ncbi:MAG: tetratricopeptide repeat protein, partial [Chitinispirillaceae bacterium]|nr:tetratricopeptide repeat protein [Chitinispirillaceae bacterium]